MSKQNVKSKTNLLQSRKMPSYFVTYQVPPVSLENGLPPKTRAAFPKAAIVPAWVSV